MPPVLAWWCQHLSDGRAGHLVCSPPVADDYAMPVGRSAAQGDTIVV
jgi:hypothetical protein